MVPEGLLVSEIVRVRSVAVPARSSWSMSIKVMSMNVVTSMQANQFDSSHVQMDKC